MPETPLEIGPDRGDLDIPPLAPGESWASARLRLRAEPTVTLEPTLQAAGDPAAGVSWVSGDWGAMRQITGFQPTFGAAPAAAAHTAVKVATGGVWFTPVPPGRVHSKTYQPVCAFVASLSPSFPPVVASALLLEFKASNPLDDASGEPAPVNLRVQSLRVTALNPVLDLSVAVGDTAPTIQHKGRLSAAIDVDLVEALRKGGAGAKLRVRAAAAATVLVSWEPVKVRAPTSPPAEAPRQPVAPGDTARWTQPAGAEPLASVSGRLRWGVIPEHVLIEAPGAPDLRLAQAIFADHGAAVSLGEPAAPLSGVAVWARARGASQGVLRLCADRRDRPAEAPLAEQPWALADGQEGWLQLPAPPELSGPLWLVILSSQGELVVPRATLPGERPPALYRASGGPWAELDEPDTAPHLHLRVRARADGPPTGQIIIRRGARAVQLSTAEAFALDAAQLATLNQATGPVTVEATSPGAGELELTDWVVRLR